MTEATIFGISDSSEYNVTSVELSGNYYFKTLLGYLVLMVEYKYTYSDGSTRCKFRKGDISDLFTLGLAVRPNTHLR